MGNQNYKEELKARILSFNKELNEVCKNCGRKLVEVRVVYATKYLTANQLVDFLMIANDIGLIPVLLGENRVQDAEMKLKYIRENNPDLTMDFLPIMIGNLQKNKINKAIDLFEEIHVIDSLELAQALNERIGHKGKVMSIFLEVNISGEESKHGIKVEEVAKVVKVVKGFSNIKLKGFMTMAPFANDPEEVRPIFRKLRKIADQYGLLTSMGMSNDWNIAIEEGTDFIRIGSRIFRH